MTRLRFERRQRRVRIYPADVPAPLATNEVELATLTQLEASAIERARSADPRFDQFCAFYGAEHRKYGLDVRPGLLACYWLARFRASAFPTQLAELAGVSFDSSRFVQWSGSMPGFQPYLAEALDEFVEFDNAGRRQVA